MRKETKIAIFSLITLALAIWGYKFLKGFNMLAKSLTVYATYEKVDGLRISSTVMVHGLQVGLVSDVFQSIDDPNLITAEMHLDSDTRVPKDAIATIASDGPMGGVHIDLVFEGTCSGNDCVQDGGKLKGITKGLLASMVTPAELRLYVDQLNDGMKEVLDTLTYRLKHSDELNKSVEDVQVTLANLRRTTDRLDKMMATSAGGIERSIANVESITKNLKDNNQQIKNILANAEDLTNDLKQANVQELVGESKVTMQKLQSTLASSDKAIADLSDLLQSLKSGDGAIPMLLNDKEFASNLEATLKNMDFLLRDLRLHPERYRRILSKKKMEYEHVPEEKDPALQKAGN
ncbi:MAG: MCE family protein [Saprospiraceae bacterium]|nr:MCE family protein [Saprospiraceae bacterium]